MDVNADFHGDGSMMNASIVGNTFKTQAICPVTKWAPPPTLPRSYNQPLIDRNFDITNDRLTINAGTEAYPLGNQFIHPTTEWHRCNNINQPSIDANKQRSTVINGKKGKLFVSLLGYYFDILPFYIKHCRSSQW